MYIHYKPKYKNKICPSCTGKMTVQSGRRGKYYRCQSCGKTLNEKPELRETAKI